MAYINPHPLGFQTEQLSFVQTLRLIEALEMAADVLSGAQEWPTFSPEDDCEPYTPAGQILEDLRARINIEVDTMRENAKFRLPTNRREADQKFEILAGLHVYTCASPAQTVAGLAKVAADIEWELQHGRSQPTHDNGDTFERLGEVVPRVVAKMGQSGCQVVDGGVS